MKKTEEEALGFVVRHYKEHTYQVENAIRTFRKLTNTTHTRYVWAIAASLAVTVCLSLSLLYKYNKDKDLVCLSAADQAKTCLLQDGSQVTLAPHATLAYHAKELQAGERLMILEGKAYFTVCHDSRHPFIVKTDQGKIQVLGTEFQVESQKEKTRVLVDKGAVSFYKDNPRQEVTLTQGMAASLENGQEVPHRVVYPENATSWVTGLFRFDHTPVQQALEEISSYCGVTLRTDATDKYVSGEMEIRNATEAIELMESLFGVKIYIDK